LHWAVRAAVRGHLTITISSRTMTTCLRCIPIFCLALAAHAQVPRGWAVASNSAGTAAQPGGLTMFHPLVPGTSVPIQGALPAAITGAGLAQPCGAASVLVDDAGNLVVGTHAPSGQPVQVFLLTLNGSTVVASSAYTLGIAAFGSGSTNQMAWVGPDLLVSNRAPLASGPLANASLGWVRPRLGPPGTPGTVVPITTSTTMNGIANALAVDSDGQFAYLGRVTGTGPYTSLIYEIPLGGTGPVTPTLLATLPDAVLNLAVRQYGCLIATIGQRAPGNVNALHFLATWSPGLVLGSLPGPGQPSALALDTVTGDVLIGDYTTGQVLRSTPFSSYQYSTPTLVTTCPVLIDGTAIRPAMNTFGAASPPSGPSWITVPSGFGGSSSGPPNPELPTLGNANFGLTVITAWGWWWWPPQTLCLFVISKGHSNPPIPLPAPFFVDLLLDPGTAQMLSLQTAVLYGWSPWGPPSCLPSPACATAPLPIPKVPTLAGLDLFAQVFAVENGTWSASAGLQFTPF